MDWTLPGAEEQTIFGATHLPDRRPCGVLLCCHGFKGYKDYGFFPHLAQAAAAQGVIAHRFNFSHSGMTHRIDTFERPDLFERDTWGKQAHDLAAVAAAVREGTLAGKGLPQVWFGHSRGGVTVLLTAAQMTATPTPEPAGIIIASAPASACSLDDDQRRQLKRLGHLPSPSSRTGQELRIGRPWLDEIEANPDAVDPVKAIARITCPVLILHGTADATVPVEAAHALREAAARPVEMELIPDASHTFNCPNPLPLDQPPPTATQRLLDLTLRFTRQTLTPTRA